MLEKPVRYQTYLPAAWEERGRDPGARPEWRFSRLLNPSTGRRRGFASLEGVMAALKQDFAIEN